VVSDFLHFPVKDELKNGKDLLHGCPNAKLSYEGGTDSNRDACASESWGKKSGGVRSGE